MPDIKWNREQWEPERTGWNQCGEGWSKAWGGVTMQWQGMLLPRISRFIPTGKILEIACGHGRWTQYLKSYCQELIAVDLLDSCIEACKARFARDPHVRCFVNDGKSLDMVPDDSIDFVFSFDSLVHVDSEVIRAYISQLPRILRTTGVAFVHHSNLGAYSHYKRLEGVPILLSILGRLGVLERNLHNRDRTVSASLVASIAEECGLRCVSHELVNWNTRSVLLDAFSVISRGSGAPEEAATVVYRNREFRSNAAYLTALSRVYGEARYGNGSRERIGQPPPNLGGRSAENGGRTNDAIGTGPSRYPED